MSLRRSHPVALVEAVLKFCLVLGATASLESFSSFPPVGVQHSALPIPSNAFTTFLSLADEDKEPEDEFDSDSPFQSRHYVYDYTNVKTQPVAPSDENPSLEGFTKQRCYPNSNPTEEDFCVYANPSFADDRGIVLYIRPSRFLEKLDSFMVFSKGSELLTDVKRSEFPYKLMHMPSKGGLGAVADRGIKIGDLVIMDYSLVVITADLSALSVEEWGPRFKYMVDLLPFKGRQLFAKQHGVGDDEISWITSAFQRNVFSAPQDNDEPGGCAFAPEPACKSPHWNHSGNMSYLNHDCRPNVAYRFNNETLQVEMRALREIAPGEELTISYIKLVDSRAERQKSLYHSYGFHCGCSQCSISDAESRASDLRLDQIVQLWNEVSDWDTHPPPTPAMAEKLIELFKEERMDVVMEEPYTMASLVFNSWGLTHEARKYASLGVSYGAYIHDKTWLDTSSHLPLIQDPENHWSYNLRTKMNLTTNHILDDLIVDYSHDEL
ncbi:hypothetical protein PCANC_05567 [Puccinia coronata f. sp. avenae]|uniref:SET domain-containing protein n=1 Tax=Puccinia coronata f. sp. avenae TaxID=200324 RepID=A0A2N5SMM5_9BASI|nr:hypothetical protein PCANC_15142 [Puccinia coronata f. sp. avenae]PLW51808.1 hypothetical protein PCANC_05567 [Puccinia coronata f. sp. avenae]